MPRVRVLADGAAAPGVIAADVWSNSHLAADRFRVRFAASAGATELVAQAGVRLSVEVGLGDEWASLALGEADAVSLDPIQGTLDVEGRDLSALLIDSRVDETFANRTASEIAEALCARHGLTADADRTETLVGRYYQSEHGRIATGQFTKAVSEWDLLAFLAGREGFELFIRGDVLRFGRGDGETIRLTPQRCTSLVLEHALGMSRAIEVTVRSWDQRAGQALTHTARGGGKGRSWKHALVRPNMPAEEAQRLAERTLADLIRHEWTARATMPGEMSISARSRVAVEGTGTEWDRVYRVGEVSRHLDARRGFSQRLRLQGGA